MWGKICSSGSMQIAATGHAGFDEINAKFFAAASPSTIIALLDVVEASRRIPRKPSCAHILLTPGWDELQAALEVFK